MSIVTLPRPTAFPNRNLKETSSQPHGGSGLGAVRQRPLKQAVSLGYSLTVMKLYLFNLTDRSLFVRPEYSKYELSVLPNAFVTFPASGDNFILSSVVGSPVSLTPEAERQHVVNLKKPFRWNHISMPEDCPWRIHCDQVASFWFYCDNRLNTHESMHRHLGSA